MVPNHLACRPGLLHPSTHWRCRAFTPASRTHQLQQRRLHSGSQHAAQAVAAQPASSPSLGENLEDGGWNDNYVHLLQLCSLHGGLAQEEETAWAFFLSVFWRSPCKVLNTSTTVWHLPVLNADVAALRAKLQLHNTMNRGKEHFTPRPDQGDHVSMYVCGVTVYDYSHIGASAWKPHVACSTAAPDQVAGPWLPGQAALPGPWHGMACHDDDGSCRMRWGRMPLRAAGCCRSLP